MITVHDDLSAHRRSDRPRLEEEFVVRCSDPDSKHHMDDDDYNIYAHRKTVNGNGCVMMMV